MKKKFNYQPGLTYGYLTLIEKLETKSGRTKWKMQCKCGNFIIKNTSVFCDKRKMGCGCRKYIDNIIVNIPSDANTITKYYFKTVKEKAIIRNLSFNITIEDIWNQYIKQNKRCIFTGLPIKFNKTSKMRTASIDRTDSSRGYEIDNIQIVYKHINIMKGILTNQEFKNIMSKIYYNQIS